MTTTLIKAIFVACALSAPMVYAEDIAAPVAPAMNMEKTMPQMHANMQKMQQQMEKLQATTDPKERQKLMDEHMLAMQETMKTMHSLGGPMMMGSDRHAGMAMTDKKIAMTEADMMQHHTLMENRVDMMQMMMEQMVQHNQAMHSTPAK